MNWRHDLKLWRYQQREMRLVRLIEKLQQQAQRILDRRDRAREALAKLRGNPPDK